MDKHLDRYLFEGVIGPSENILWIGRPSRSTYIIGGLPFFLIGLIWGLIDIGILIAAIMSGSLEFPILLFLLIHAFPFYLGIFGLIRRVVEYRNVCYAYTDKRVILREGFIGADFQMVDYTHMFNIRVKTNPIEHLQGRGSVTISTGEHGVSDKGISTRQVKLQSVKDPYQVLSELQSISSKLREDS